MFLVVEDYVEKWDMFSTLFTFKSGKMVINMLLTAYPQSVCG